MNRYVFILGRSIILARVELLAVISSFPHKIIFEKDNFIDIEFSNGISPVNLMNLLGGVIKIAKFIDSSNYAIDIAIAGQFARSQGKCDFGVSFYGGDFGSDREKGLVSLCQKVKELAREKNINLRYVLPKKGLELSSVVVKKQNLREFLVLTEKESAVLTETAVVQDFENWNKRDYQRPCVDPKKGMLPPKVARMMINLGGAETKGKILLDPFCGVGTILAEAQILGYSVLGSDFDAKQVDFAKKNLEWLNSQYAEDIEVPNFKLYLAAAEKISEKIPAKTIDLIVTEPYLGPSDFSKLNPGKLERVVNGLAKMYIGALNDWREILKNQGKIIVVFPVFNLEKREKRLFDAVDKRVKTKYNLIGGPYPYFREQARVRREIYILGKK